MSYGPSTRSNAIKMLHAALTINKHYDNCLQCTTLEDIKKAIGPYKGTCELCKACDTNCQECIWALGYENIWAYGTNPCVTILERSFKKIYHPVYQSNSLEELIQLIKARKERLLQYIAAIAGEYGIDAQNIHMNEQHNIAIKYMFSFYKKLLETKSTKAFDKLTKKNVYSNCVLCSTCFTCSLCVWGQTKSKNAYGELNINTCRKKNYSEVTFDVIYHNYSKHPLEARKLYVKKRISLLRKSYKQWKQNFLTMDTK